MNKINVHNYKEFTIDYMIGNLSAQDAEAFTLFLSEHPDIADEILLFETDNANQISSGKQFNSLKKNLCDLAINEDNFEEYCIASIEGDLDKQSEHALTLFIGNNKERQATKAVYEQTKLIPEVITYPHKDKLIQTKHKALWRTRSIRIASALVAASIIACAFFFFKPNQNINTATLADNNIAVSTNQAGDSKTQTDQPSEIVDIQDETTNNNINNETIIPKQQTTQPAPAKVESKEISPKEKEDKGISNTNEILEKLKSKNVTMPQNNVAINDINLKIPPTREQILTDDNGYENINQNTITTTVNKLIYNTVLSQGVKSINKLTESDLGYKVIKDKNGNPVEVVIKSRFGEIARPLAQN